MASNDLLYALLGVLFLLLVNVFMVARTAKSKQRGHGIWVIFALVSPSLATALAIFIRPKQRDRTSPYRPNLLSMFGYGLAIAVQVWGLSHLPVSETMTDQDIVNALATQSGLGSLWIFAAGVLLMTASVTNEFVRDASPQGR